MESSVEITKTTTLVLDQKEAVWLRNRMQNPPSLESREDAQMREAFFNALTNARAPDVAAS